jgi:hypothetical protein
VDEAEEAAVEEQLRRLRQQIAAAKHQGGQMVHTTCVSPGRQPLLGSHAWLQQPSQLSHGSGGKRGCHAFVLCTCPPRHGRFTAPQHHADIPIAGRKLREEVQRYDEELPRAASTLAALAAVPAPLAGKENAVAEDSRALAAVGMALEEGLQQLGRLRLQKGGAQRGGGAGPKDGACMLPCMGARASRPAGSPGMAELPQAS